MKNLSKKMAKGKYDEKKAKNYGVIMLIELLSDTIKNMALLLVLGTKNVFKKKEQRGDAVSHWEGYCEEELS